MMHARMDALRCLPLQLSGAAMRAIARASTRGKALCLCRANVARFSTPTRRATDEWGRSCARWATEQLLVISVTMSTAPVPADDGMVSSILRGHVLGDVPEASVQESHIRGTDTIPGKAAALYDGKKTKTSRRTSCVHRRNGRAY